MGFHVCQYCQNAGVSRPATSSGDTILILRKENGEEGKFEVPDMLPHYVADHGYCPPKEFIDFVMQGQVSGGVRMQTKSLNNNTPPVKIGYLEGDFDKGSVPGGFVQKLETVMQAAANMGLRQQTRAMW